MTVTEMHVAIEQGLQQSGRYGNRVMDPAEYDIAINSETILLLDKVFQDRIKLQNSKVQLPHFEVDMHSAQITSAYKREEVKVPTDSTDYCEAQLANTVHMIINHQAGYYTGNGIELSKVEKNTTYRCIVRSKYDTTWYETGSVFTTGNVVLLFYGTVEKVRLQYHPARLLSSETIQEFLQSHYHKTVKENPVSELINRNKLRTYQNNFTINSVKAEYSIYPAKVSFTSTPKVDSDLPENIQQWLINKVISKILNNNKEPQQQIENLKTETI